MSKKVLKRAIGSVIRKTRSYMRQLEAEGEPNQEDDNDQSHQSEFAYYWLNSKFSKLAKEPGCPTRFDYLWGVLQGAYLASAIGVNRISVLEFGVAGGNGLIALEQIAKKVEQIFAIDIDVYGFDTGGGLPKPMDYRDCPNLWSAGYFCMDKEKLQRRLQRAKLVLGLVEETVPAFLKSNPSPVAFVSFDLDYYTSTMQAFRLLDADEDLLLPRIHCYFDDITGFTYSDYTGERLAISDFNAAHPMRKISPIYGLKHFLPAPHADSWWPEMFFMAHIFDHKRYNRNDGLVKPVVGGLTELAD